MASTAKRFPGSQGRLSCEIIDPVILPGRRIIVIVITRTAETLYPNIVLQFGVSRIVDAQVVVAAASINASAGDTADPSAATKRRTLITAQGVIIEIIAAGRGEVFCIVVLHPNEVILADIVAIIVIAPSGIAADVRAAAMKEQHAIRTGRHDVVVQIICLHQDMRRAGIDVGSPVIGAGIVSRACWKAAGRPALLIGLFIKLKNRVVAADAVKTVWTA